MNGSSSLVPKLSALLAAVALGIPCGVIANNRLAPADSQAPARSSQAPPLPTVPDREPPLDPDTLRRQLEDTNAELRLKVGLLEDLRAHKTETRSPQEKVAAAKDLCDTYYRILKSENGDERLTLMSRWGELDPEMATYFITRYRQSRLEPFSHVPLELALQCGGKDAGAFVEELLTGTLYTADEKARVLRYVDGVSPEEPIASFPVSETLLQVADQLSRSTNSAERKGSAGLLGMSGTTASSRTLKALAGADPDPGVRAAALRALGQSKDPKNLPYLEELQTAWTRATSDGKPRPGQEDILRALRTAILQLKSP